jgi:uncharacterized repeat protein (TIGR01451 family)
MNRITSRLGAICAFAWVFGSNGAFADTSIPQTNFTSNQLWTLAGSPYIINGNVQVNNGATLTIDPGVVVKFSGAHALTVAGGTSGTLRAIGTAENKIVFTTTTGTHLAASIRFEDASIDAAFDGSGGFTSGSILQYVTVEHIGSDGAIVLNNAHPFISHATVQNNQAAGIYGFSISGLLRIENSMISANSAPSDLSKHGAGVRIASVTGADVRLRDNVIAGNTALGQGGGLYVSNGGTLLLEANVIDDNQSGGSGGGLFLSGPGTTTSTRNTISNNYTGNDGGGAFIQGGPVSMTGDTIRGNESVDRGGGIRVDGSALTLTYSLVSGNRAMGMGGGLFLENSGNTLSHCVVANNETLSHSGGVDLHGSATIDRCVIAGNKSKLYGAGVGFSTQSGTLTNSTVAQNTGGPSVTVYLPSTIQSNTITQNTTGHGAVAVYVASQIGSNNLFGNNSTWEFATEVTGTTSVPSTWWGTTDTTAIGSKLWHPYGDIDLNPIATQIHTGNPVSPPTSIAVTPTATSFRVGWAANPESDVAGYRVYLRQATATSFDAPIDVGLQTSYELPVLPGGNYVVAVTAYDSNDPGVSDDPNTPVNEKQTNGVESWYSLPKPVVVVEADISVAVTAGTNNSNGVGNLVSGELMYYQATLTNLGPSDAASDMTVTLSVTSGVNLIVPSGCTGTAQSVACTRPALALGASTTIDITATVGSANAMVTATATASSPDDPDPMGTNNSAQSAPICVNCPDLVTTWPTAPTVGTPSLATESVVTVRNQGRVAANNVMLSITVPDGVSIATTPACAAVNNTLECSLGTLAPGAQSDVGVSIVATGLGTQQVTANVSAAEIESSTANNAATISTRFTDPADLSIAFTDNGATAAQKQLYGISVTNSGPATANTVLVTVTLPAGLLAVTDNTQCATTDGMLVCALGNLGVGASATLAFTTLYSGNGSFELTAVVSSDEFDPDSSDNTAKLTTTVGSTGQNPGATGGKKKGGGAMNPLLLALLAFWSLARARRKLKYPRQ